LWDVIHASSSCQSVEGARQYVVATAQGGVAGDRWYTPLAMVAFSEVLPRTILCRQGQSCIPHSMPPLACHCACGRSILTHLFLNSLHNSPKVFSTPLQLCVCMLCKAGGQATCSCADICRLCSKSRCQQAKQHKLMICSLMLFKSQQVHSANICRLCSKSTCQQARQHKLILCSLEFKSQQIQSVYICRLCSKSMCQATQADDIQLVIIQVTADTQC